MLTTGLSAIVPSKYFSRMAASCPKKRCNVNIFFLNSNTQQHSYTFSASFLTYQMVFIDRLWTEFIKRGEARRKKVTEMECTWKKTDIEVSNTSTFSSPRWRPPRERKVPGSNPVCSGIFSGSSHTCDLNIDTSGYPARRLAL